MLTQAYGPDNQQLQPQGDLRSNHAPYHPFYHAVGQDPLPPQGTAADGFAVARGFQAPTAVPENSVRGITELFSKLRSPSKPKPQVRTLIVLVLVLMTARNVSKFCNKRGV
jgi:hypothetical protein